MNVVQTYRLHITPLSPVHIGTGQSYEPTNYVIEDEILYEFDTGSAMAALFDKDRQDLLKLSSQRPSQDLIKSLQRFFFERRDSLMAFAVNQVPVLPGVANLYGQRIGRAANSEAGGKEVLNRLEIDRTAFDPIARQPILYGSSLKGAIRTALLDKVNSCESLRVLRDKRTGKDRRENNLEFQQRLFQFRAGKFELDPMRLVQVADAKWDGGADLPSAQVHLAVNRKKSPVVDKQGKLVKAMGENLYQILECVSPWRYRAFCGQLNIQPVTALGSAAGLPDPTLRFSAGAIADACNRFYRPLLKAENGILQARGFGDKQWLASIEKVLACSEKKAKGSNAFLLRVGRHSGAEAVTVNGAREGNIRIKRGKGQRDEFRDAAKTLWLAADEKDQSRNLLPFGWVLIEIDDLAAPAEPLNEIARLCDPHLDASRIVAQRLVRTKERLEATRQALAAKRVEEETLRCQAAEREAEAARLAEEQRSRLAALSDNQRRVEALRSELNPGSRNRGPGHQLYNRLRLLIQEAGEWPESDRKTLRDTAVTVFDWLGIKKDDSNRKKLLRSLIPPTP
ncbi:RAMP superfamily CRISPR-associated protein [Methylolobus aquaticus]